MSKISKIAAGAAVVPMLAFAAPAFAANSLGQLGGGDNYQAKNLTTGSAYGDNTTATCNDVVKYSMQLSNTQFGTLDSVNLKATLPSQGGVSTATATTNLGGTSGASDTTTVTLSSGATQTLVNGSTELDDSNGNAIKTLPDTVTTSGVDIGALVGSTTEFVNFKAKVTCPTPPVTPPTTPTQPKPTTLVNTGAGDVAGLFAVVAAAGAFGYRLFLGRRLSRQ